MADYLLTCAHKTLTLNLNVTCGTTTLKRPAITALSETVKRPDRTPLFSFVYIYDDSVQNGHHS